LSGMLRRRRALYNACSAVCRARRILPGFDIFSLTAPVTVVLRLRRGDAGVCPELLHTCWFAHFGRRLAAAVLRRLPCVNLNAPAARAACAPGVNLAGMLPCSFSSLAAFSLHLSPRSGFVLRSTRTQASRCALRQRRRHSANSSALLAGRGTWRIRGWPGACT